MKRITEAVKVSGSIIKYKINKNQKSSAINKLGYLEDMEESGKMLLLPCGIGDTVYANNNTFGILPYTVDCIVVEKDSIVFQCSSYSYYECLDEIEVTASDFGKDVFLTKEEAEKLFNEMG